MKRGKLNSHPAEKTSLNSHNNYPLSQESRKILSFLAEQYQEVEECFFPISFIMGFTGLSRHVVSEKLKVLTTLDLVESYLVDPSLEDDGAKGRPPVVYGINEHKFDIVEKILHGEDEANDRE